MYTKSKKTERTFEVLHPQVGMMMILHSRVWAAIMVCDHAGRTSNWTDVLGRHPLLQTKYRTVPVQEAVLVRKSSSDGGKWNS